VTAAQIILLVEDNDDDAELTTKAFVRARVTNQIVRARDGVEALDYLLARGEHSGRDTSDVPAFVLLDLNLPRVDGIGVLRAIRADATNGHVPVVILTSSDEDKDRIAAYEHHANSFVQKPVDYDAFVEAARQLGLYWLVLNRPAPARK
jgi:two-component system response regulator